MGGGFDETTHILSIGQMFEFLFDWEDRENKVFNFWEIFTIESSKPFYPPWVFYDREKGELRDPLWEAVKEILEK